METIKRGQRGHCTVKRRTTSIRLSEETENDLNQIRSETGECWSMIIARLARLSAGKVKSVQKDT